MQKVFVGDVQGCAVELEELIARCEQQFGEQFEMWSVGDLINRGPFNLRALSLMRELVEAGRGRYVLGNHEIGLLRVWLGLREFRPQETAGEVLAASDAEDWVHWIRSRPLVVPGEIEGHPFVMVHASVHPDWTLDELCQRAERVAARLADADLANLRELLSSDPSDDVELVEDRNTLGRLTRCRSIGTDGTWSSGTPEHDADAWHQRWSSESHEYGVVYGHWAQQGLHVENRLRGLDTGCVHHGRGRDGFLTAWLPRALRESRDPFAQPDDRFWQIPAHRRYYGA